MTNVNFLTSGGWVAKLVAIHNPFSRTGKTIFF
jgi:hypothetical protein